MAAMNTMNPTSHCRWCGMIHGPMCNMVKSIEFHADGITVKRVEFKGAADYPKAADIAKLATHLWPRS